MKPSLDTNVLARWIIRDNEEQTSIVDTLLLGKQSFIVDMAVLTELEHLLRSQYLFPRSLIVRHFQIIAAHPRLVVDEALLNRILENYATHPALSFVDCSLHAYAEAGGNIPLLTFDKKLAKQLYDVELLK